MTEPLAAAEAAVRAGNPQQALVALTAAVKASPAKPALRIFLAQLLCVTGAWERAHTQLNVVADMDATTGPMREMVGHALRCELLRAAVFEGKRSPMVFGQPDEWLAMLIESMLQSGQGASDLVAPARGTRLRGRAGHQRADQRRALRMDRRRRFAPRPGARSDGQRPLLLDPVQPPEQHLDRRADRSARPGLAAGAHFVQQRRRSRSR